MADSNPFSNYIIAAAKGQDAEHRYLTKHVKEDSSGKELTRMIELRLFL